MATGENVTLQPYTKGMISNASHYVLDTDSFSYLENFNVDKAGVIASRQNIQEAFTQTNSVQGVGFFESGSNTDVWFKSGADLKYFNAQAPSTVSGTFASFFPDAAAVARFSPIQDVMIIASPGMTPKVINSTGSVLWTVGFHSSVGIILAGFAGRVWAVPTSNTVNKTDELYYTDVLPQNLTTTAITGGTEFLKINTKGRAITALIEENNTMYVFTNDSIFRVYSTQAQDNAPIANVGTFRQESVVRTPAGIFFIGNSGIYRLSDSPEKISTPIDDFFYKLNILRSPESSGSSGYPKNVFGWSDENSVYFSVERDPQYGASYSTDVSFPDRSYIIKYNFISGAFSVYSTFGLAINMAGSNNFSINLNNEYVSINPFVFIAGKDFAGTQNRVGFIRKSYYRGNKPRQSPTSTVSNSPYGDWTINGNPTARTQPVFCHAETQWITMGMENKQKKISGISIASENAAGFKLYYQIDKEGSNYMFDNGTWEEIGTISDDYVTIFKSFDSRTFNRIKFKISGASLGVPVEIGQITFLKVEDKGYGK